MYGAILGDMIGAPYEFDRGNKTKDFPLFSADSEFTDDSVMTIAVADALMESMGEDDEQIKKTLVSSMQKWGRRYPYAGYGGRFIHWLHAQDPQPYGSYGNGSAMRVSSVGWLFDTLEETRRMARVTAEVSHNHPEGLKGAEATASAIFLARTGAGKEDIRDFIVGEFEYDLSRTCDEIRPTYHHVESCQETVPEAITAFLEGESFEDVVRTAVSLGGDCDTLTCIAGSIAEAFYGVPDELREECRKRLPKDMLAVLDRFEDVKDTFHDSFLNGNELIEAAIHSYYSEATRETLNAVLDSIRTRMHQDGHLMIPVMMSENAENFSFHTIQTKDGKLWLAAFTSPKEYRKGKGSEILSNTIDAMLQMCLDTDAPGIIINPWGESFLLARELIEMIRQADGGLEYSVPNDTITAELLEDGTFLKRATEICDRNRTELNLVKLARILRDSWVWVPCTAIFSDEDNEVITRAVMEAYEKGEQESLIGREFTSRDEVRLFPDILQNGEDYFFPVFTSSEEMGEYGERFSQLQKPFLEAMILARNNEKDVKGIVINAFSEPFVIPKEVFDVIAEMPSNIKQMDITVKEVEEGQK